MPTLLDTGFVIIRDPVAFTPALDGIILIRDF